MMQKRFKIHSAAVKPILVIAACVFFLAIAMACESKQAQSAEAQAISKGEKSMDAPPPKQNKTVLQSSLAGSWYQASKSALDQEIQGYLDKVEARPMDDVMALILPHAGYRYSGQTAAYGVKNVVGRHYSRVIVMGPTHRHPMRDTASVPDVTHYATPLGAIPLDTEFIGKLKSSPYFKTVPQVHEGEHSVQIEVPLLQKALGDFTIVPMVVGQLGVESAKEMAKILNELIDSETLIVVSSDFTHYGARFGYTPFRDDVKNNLEKLDMGAADLIKTKDLPGFAKYLDDTGATICGRCPIMVLLAMLPNNAQAHLLRYDTSGNLTGDYQNSVSYASFAFTGKWKSAGESQKKSEDEVLSAEDKKQLLKLARGTLTYYLENHKSPSPEKLGVAITDSMKKVMGAFVTLKIHGQLRGCIGEIIPFRPLYQAVQAQAVNAGTRDHRFRPVNKSELTNIEFEISALTPPVTVKSYKDIVVGKHGVVLKKNGRQAVFLPQVAPEQGWDRDTMLSYLAQKAGLPAGAWKSGATFDVFEAIVFHEDEK